MFEFFESMIVDTRKGFPTQTEAQRALAVHAEHVARDKEKALRRSREIDVPDRAKKEEYEGL